MRVNSAASVDGYQNGNAAGNFDPSDAVTTATAWTLLADAAGANPWNGDLAEVVIYSSALSDADRVTVRDYLNTKYVIF